MEQVQGGGEFSKRPIIYVASVNPPKLTYLKFWSKAVVCHMISDFIPESFLKSYLLKFHRPLILIVEIPERFEFSY